MGDAWTPRTAVEAALAHVQTTPATQTRILRVRVVSKMLGWVGEASDADEPNAALGTPASGRAWAEERFTALYPKEGVADATYDKYRNLFADAIETVLGGEPRATRRTSAAVGTGLMEFRMSVSTGTASVQVPVGTPLDEVTDFLAMAGQQLKRWIERAGDEPPTS